MSRKHIAQLIGRVFIQKSAVNLLSTVLDTPEFFWSAPDSMQSLYKVGWWLGCTAHWASQPSAQVHVNVWQLSGRSEMGVAIHCTGPVPLSQA